MCVLLLRILFPFQTVAVRNTLVLDYKSSLFIYFSVLQSQPKIFDNTIGTLKMGNIHSQTVIFFKKAIFDVLFWFSFSKHFSKYQKFLLFLNLFAFLYIGLWHLFCITPHLFIALLFSSRLGHLFALTSKIEKD